MQLTQCLTDNSNRSATLVRTAISKANAKLAEPGSVAFQFKRCGQVMVTANDGVEEDQVCLPWLHRRCVKLLFLQALAVRVRIACSRICWRRQRVWHCGAA